MQAQRDIFANLPSIKSDIDDNAKKHYMHIPNWFISRVEDHESSYYDQNFPVGKSTNSKMFYFFLSKFSDEQIKPMRHPPFTAVQYVKMLNNSCDITHLSKDQFMKLLDKSKYLTRPHFEQILKIDCAESFVREVNQDGVNKIEWDDAFLPNYRLNILNPGDMTNYYRMYLLYENIYYYRKYLEILNEHGDKMSCIYSA